MAKCELWRGQDPRNVSHPTTRTDAIYSHALLQTATINMADLERANAHAFEAPDIHCHHLVTLVVGTQAELSQTLAKKPLPGFPERGI